MTRFFLKGLLLAGGALNTFAMGGLELNSTTVVQVPVGLGIQSEADVTTYYKAEGVWPAAVRVDWRIEIEGGLADTGGLGPNLGSQWSLNELQEESRIFVALLEIMGSSADGRWHWELGKISPKGSFDDNRAARAKLTKFISEPLVKNSAVAFAKKGFGGVLKWDLSPALRLSACLSDANARSTEAGFTTWRGEWFRGIELTLRPRPEAAIRLLAWGTERGGVRDGGWGLSADWELAPRWVVFARAGGGGGLFCEQPQTDRRGIGPGRTIWSAG